MTLHLGTSGWAYPEWKPDFYPAGLPRDRFLEHYASVLGACEVNATHYRLQSGSAVANWAAAVPDGFRFVAKAHRRLTHARDLGGAPEFMEDFLESLRPLGDRLGAILLQLPPSRTRDDAALAALMSQVPADLPFAMEFRHESWIDDAVTTAVVNAGGTLCVSDTTGTPPDALPPGRIAHVRLRAEKYTEEARRRWLELLVREAADRDVYAFAKHEGVPAGNPFAGVTMAEWMARQRAWPA
ncbi:MAG: DUF72 domain-containing protein [Thermoleophilia bacterium]|nr:DUF72 domain-containing protein [Thermoleophilia bacterium]